MIRDLEANDASFATEAASWGVTSLSGSKVTYCYNAYLLGGYGSLGGYGQYFYRTYYNLPPHVMIHFTLNMWALDSWDSDDSWYIQFDSTAILGPVSYVSYWPTGNYCGNSWADVPNWRMYGTVYHYGPTVTVYVIGYFDEGSINESFGIRELTLLFDQNPAGTSSSVFCGKNAYFTNYNRDCYCSAGYYYTGSYCASCDARCSACYGPNTYQCYGCTALSNIYYDGYNCLYCHSYCSSCFGATASQCYTCNSGYYYFSWTTSCYVRCIWPLTTSGSTCVAPCSSTNYYYPNGDCVATCTAPMYEVQVLGVVRICVNPCAPTEYIYWDGTCQQECVSPLTVSVSHDIKYCIWTSSCSQYLRWDQTCSSTCDYPFRVKIVQGKKLCLKPCPGTQDTYWNGDCMDSCSSQLTVTTTGGVDYCTYPCATTKYLYWDYECLDTCPYPLHTRTERNRLYCDYPTSSSEYLYWDGTSSTTCDPPLTWSTQGTGTYLRYFCNYGCPIYDFLYWNGTCAEECLYPLTAVIQNSRQFCTYTCTNPGEYLYWNRSCIASCYFPLNTRTEGGKLLCDYPCQPWEVVYTVDGECASECASLYSLRIEGTAMLRNFCDFPCPTATPIMYRNGTCMASCNSPLVTSTFHSSYFCDFPCDDGEYLYYNGSCLEFCDTPFSPRVVGIERYCNLACPADEKYFYYWNGTCATSCPDPFVVQVIEEQKWCVYPCLSNQFMTENGECVDTCEWPLLVKLEAGYKYCVFQCDASEYLYWNQTCIGSCPAPLRTANTSLSVSGVGYLCVKPCDDPQDYYSNVTGECVSSCNGPSVDSIDDYTVCLAEVVTVDNGTVLDVFLDSHSISDYFGFAVPIKMLQYIKYLDLETMPPRLKRFTYGKGRTMLSLRIGQAMSADLDLSIPASPLPSIFEKHGLHSRFLINFWGELMTWAIVLVSFMICYVLEGICVVMDMPDGKSFFEKLRPIFGWNFLFILIGTSLDEIILYASLEFRTLGNWDQDYSIVSLLLCLACISLVIGLIPFTLYLAKQWKLAKQRALARNSPEEMDTFTQRWQGYQVLFRGFRGKSAKNVHPSHWFWALYMVRMGLPMVFAAWFYFSPLTQIVFYLIISNIALGYIWFMKPLLRRINYIQLLIVESIIYIINVSLLILQILGMKTAFTNHLAAILGDIILAGNCIIDITIVVFLFLKFIQGINAIRNYQSAQPIKHRGLYLQLLVYFAQQTGMGFEEFFIDPQTDAIFNQPKYLVGGGPGIVPARKEIDVILKAQSEFIVKEKKTIIDDPPSRASLGIPDSGLMSPQAPMTFSRRENLESIHAPYQVEEEDEISPLPRFVAEHDSSTMKFLNEDNSVADMKNPNVSIAEFQGVGDEPFTLAQYLKTNQNSNVINDNGNRGDEEEEEFDDAKRRQLDSVYGRRPSLVGENNNSPRYAPESSVRELPELNFMRRERGDSQDEEPLTKRTMID